VAQPPQYGQHPQQHQFQPQAYAQPREGIAVKTEYSPMEFMFAAFTPKIFINGYEVPVAGWGWTVVPLVPGVHHVHVHTPYFLPSRIGAADATVEVRPGQITELQYKAPLSTFSPGSLGVGPQKYNGLGALIAVLVIVFVVMALFMMMAFV
jgi:hypothetical protein